MILETMFPVTLNKRLFFSFIYFCIFSTLIALFSVSNGMQESELSDGEHSSLEIIVKNVGQGNCIIVRVPREKTSSSTKKLYDVMLVDCGSSSYKGPFQHTSHPQTPAKVLASPPMRKKDRISDIIDKPQVPLSLKIERREILADILEYVPQKNIKCVLITHPDIDHYGWVESVLQSRKWEWLILGGAPEKYLNSSNDISKLLKKNSTKAYYTAASEGGADSAQLGKGIYTKQPAFFFHDPEAITKKLNFNPRFEFRLLAINSNHVTSLGADPKVVNISSNEEEIDDYNTDSIILKITDTRTKKSIILTGDATGMTTTRLMDHAKDSELANILQANVLVASHHGSSSHGTNNEAWIRTVNPEYIVISTGGSYGHPTKKAYAAFHTSPRLMRVPEHSVFVGGLTEDSIYNHVTTSGIFSTLPHGDIRIIFPEDEHGSITINSENTTQKDQPYTGEPSSPSLSHRSETKIYPVKNLADMREPMSYEEIMTDLNRLKPLSPMKLDLDDSRNHFIVQFLTTNSKAKLEQESLEDAAAVLEFKNHLVGELLLGGEPTGFTIDLKDPRNLHLLRQIAAVSATSQIHSPLQSNISPRMPLKSSASPRSSEIKEPTILHKVSKEEFLSFFGYLLKTHTLPEVTKKLKENGNRKATRTYVDQLSKGMWQEDYPDTFSQLQRLFPEEYKKWDEKK